MRPAGPAPVEAKRTRLPETENITLNVGHVDLGRIDLLVRDGFFSNRTDLIRTAIRNQLDRHEEVLRNSASRGGLEFGLRHVIRAELELAKAAGAPIAINVVGLASIADDVTPQLARSSIALVQVLGSLQAMSPLRRRFTTA